MNKEMNEYFAIIANDITINKNKKIISWSKGGWRTAYCSSSISGKTNSTYTAKLKINKCWGMVIGIEYGNYKTINGDFTNKDYNKNGEYYGYGDDGNTYCHQHEYRQLFGDEYDENDVISLKVEFSANAKYGKLYFCKNNGSFIDTNYKLNRHKNLKMAVGLQSSSSSLSSVEIISFIKSEISGNDNDEKEEKKNKTTDILINELLSENEKYKNKINCLESINNKIMRENERYKTMINSLKSENVKYGKLNNLLSSKEDEMKEKEKEKDVQNLQNDLLNLENSLISFTSYYDDNIIYNLFKESAESILVNNEINSLDLRLRSFSSRLIDIKSYIVSLTVPDINKYKEWNINNMILWICGLENGRFKVYKNRLKSGFESDGIDAGDCLPDLSVETLRNKPFNITKFRDRRDLSKHFQSLKNHQIINNNNNHQNEEGAFTEYH